LLQITVANYDHTKSYIHWDFTSRGVLKGDSVMSVSMILAHEMRHAKLVIRGI